jgi:hypothetical protein
VLSESVRLASTVPLPPEPTQAIREMYALARSFARSRHVEITGQRLPFFIHNSLQDHARGLPHDIATTSPSFRFVSSRVFCTRFPSLAFSSVSRTRYRVKSRNSL